MSKHKIVAFIFVYMVASGVSSAAHCVSQKVGLQATLVVEDYFSETRQRYEYSRLLTRSLSWLGAHGHLPAETDERTDHGKACF